jgi:hypothetical protein
MLPRSPEYSARDGRGDQERHSCRQIEAHLLPSTAYFSSISANNGPEFVSRIQALDQWAYWNKAELDFSRAGKPTDNAFIESFNGRARQELLNAS